MIDISKVKPGDKVTMKEGTVIAVRDLGAVYPISIDFGGDASSFSPNSIATHTPAPKPLVPGNRVKWGAGPAEMIGEIKAIDGDDAWIKAGDYNYIISVANLRHADAPADEIVVTEEEVERATYIHDRTYRMDGQMRGALVDFLKRRKEAGR